MENIFCVVYGENPERHCFRGLPQMFSIIKETFLDSFLLFSKSYSYNDSE